MVRATSHGTRERCKVKHVTRLFALSIFDDAMDDDSNVIILVIKNVKKNSKLLLLTLSSDSTQ